MFEEQKEGRIQANVSHSLTVVAHCGKTLKLCQNNNKKWVFVLFFQIIDFFKIYPSQTYVVLGDIDFYEVD